MIDQYTSTGVKLLHQPDVLLRLKSIKQATPISLQVAPTSICNLKCEFCSNVNRTKHENLDLNDLMQFIESMRDLGLKTVEWTGGGDPTQYRYINAAISMCDSLKLKQGMITNGVALKDNLTWVSLKALDWIRISMNCLEYVSNIEIPEFEGTLGFSYVWNEKTSKTTLDRIHKYVEKFKPAYVRIVPNCQTTKEEQETNNTVLKQQVDSWGHPYFYQPKSFRSPVNCYWGYFKPFLLHNGFVYPCSSVVLNDNAERSFHEKYAWMRMEEFAEVFSRTIQPLSSSSCDHCVFCDQNEMIHNILNPNGMESFI